MSSSDNVPVIIRRKHAGKSQRSTSKLSGSFPLSHAVKYKYIAAVSAAGAMCSSAVFLLADKDLGADYFYRYILDCQTMTLPNVSAIYICFTRTRFGNQKFFDWYTNEILLQWIKTTQSKCPENERKAMLLFAWMASILKCNHISMMIRSIH